MGADGGWCRRRSSKPLRGADGVPGGFDSHTLPSSRPLRALPRPAGALRRLARALERARRRPIRLATTVVLALIVALVVNLANPAVLAAQEGDPPPPPADSVPADSVRPDTAGAAVAEDSVVSPVVRAEADGAADSGSVPSGPAPMSAFLRSVLVPGWGQLAADQPVRAAVYFALQSATVFMVIRTQNRIDEAEGEGLKEARREQREDWIVLAGFWALASGIDAWVSAQMWGFEGEVVPPPEGTAGVAVRLRVPVAGF